MVRFFAFLLGFLLVAHYVVLGTGDIGSGDIGAQWRDTCMAFWGKLGFNEMWQLRMTRGMPAVLVGGIMAIWAVWPRKK